MFEKLRVKKGLNISSAYDSVLEKRWDIQSMPHIVIVDPEGIVRYITSGADMDQQKIQALMEVERHVSLHQKDAVQPKFDPRLKTCRKNDQSFCTDGV